jgi:pyruvate formate lyase activating enzyme
MIGKIHSIESMGLVDGPGIRTVVFFQGCKLRCAYCHNPDTWATFGGKETESEELLKKILRYKPYFTRSGGGVTFSGGDPLMQPDFLIEMLKLCKENGIHTVIDTAGYGTGRYEEILKYTDLILFDIKHVTSEGYKELTGQDDKEAYKFLRIAQKLQIPLWIRHVVVPGITVGEEHFKKLAEIINSLKYVEKIELLPYHTLGVNKYETMGIKYRLNNVEPMTKAAIKEIEKVLLGMLDDNYKNKLKITE